MPLSSLIPNTFVRCPYQKAHRVLICRLPTHLVRCARRHPNVLFLRCPLNNTHTVKAEELLLHLMECTYATVEYTMLEKFTPVEPQPPIKPIVETAENWDDEPPVPSYNPTASCKTRPILVRPPDGLSKTERKEYRRKERQRIRALLEAEERIIDTKKPS